MTESTTPSGSASSPARPESPPHRPSASLPRARRSSSRRGREDHCRELAERIAAAGGRRAVRAADLTDERQVGDAVAACVDAFGRIDGLFSVAGGSGRRFGDGPIHEVTRRRLGSRRSRSTENAGAGLPRGRRADARPGAERVRDARLDPPHGQRHGDGSGAGALRDARLRRRARCDDRADDGDGSDLPRRSDPRQRRRAMADANADGRDAPPPTSRSSPSLDASSRSPARCSTRTRSLSRRSISSPTSRGR